MGKLLLMALEVERLSEENRRLRENGGIGSALREDNSRLRREQERVELTRKEQERRWSTELYEWKEKAV